MFKKNDIVYHKQLKIIGWVYQPPTRNTSNCVIIDLEKEMQGLPAKLEVKEYDLELQCNGEG